MGKKITFLATAGLVLALAVFAGSAQADPVGQLGKLDVSGINPATGATWALGDTYHLVYITTNTTVATSTDIADYNAFVQSDAAAEGMGGANWFVMGSTADANAIDNAIVTSPVINISDSGVVAADSDDFWDLDFSSSAHPLTLEGGDTNVHFGTMGGGTVHSGLELGAVNDSVRIEWSGWTNWSSAWRGESTESLKPLVAVSEELTVVPEPATMGLLALGGLAMLRRRRRS